jgi:hypothetical protein
MKERQAYVVFVEINNSFFILRISRMAFIVSIIIVTIIIATRSFVEFFQQRLFIAHCRFFKVYCDEKSSKHKFTHTVEEQANVTVIA